MSTRYGVKWPYGGGGGGGGGGGAVVGRSQGILSEQG